MESAMLRPSLMLTSMAATDTPMEVSTAHMFTMASVMLRPSPKHGAMASVASTDTQLSTEDTPMEDITMESVMLRPSLMLTSMVATDTPMEVSTAHMFTMASVMLRPNPTHGAMASVASTDTQLSTEDTPTEDITMESA